MLAAVSSTDHNPLPAASFNIRSIPTLAIFHRGKQLAQQAGALPQQQFSAWVLRNLPQ